jgi:hypothetical protein
VLALIALARLNLSLSEMVGLVEAAGNRSRDGGDSKSVAEEIELIESIMSASISRYDGPMPGSAKTYRERYSELMRLRHRDDADDD